MTDGYKISDDKIQEYIDGRLGDRDQAAMASHLLSDPQKAAEIQELRQQNEALKALGSEVLDEPVPEKLTKIVENARRARGDHREQRAWLRGVMQMAAVILVFCAGVVGGWVGHSTLRPGPDSNALALLTARDAYLLYALEKDYPVEFPADRESELAGWIEKIFKRNIAPPPLDPLGYQYVGGQIIPWAGGQQGLYLFQDEGGQRVAVIFWPSTAPPKKLMKMAANENLQFRFWWRDGFGFAVLADKVNKQLDKVAKSITEFYSKES